MKANILCRSLTVLLGLVPIALLSASAEDKTPAVPKSIAAALEPFVDNHTLAGAVTLVADKDKVLNINTVGYADIAAKSLMAADTLFWIASESKPITATLVMMLLDDGKLQLDDPVEKYLPEFKDLVVAGPDKQLKKPSHAVTIREILSHTSGMSFQSAQEQPTLDVLSLRDAALSYAKTPLLCEPGTKWQYSNAGINTAGRVIEVVSGMPYEDFLEKRLLTPLGMKDTTFWPNEEQLRRLAKAYRPTKDKKGLEETTIVHLKYPLNDRKRQPMPGGGLFSTAGDIGRFCQMFLGGGVYQGKRYLSENAVKQMTSKQTSDAMKVSQGLGWFTGPPWFTAAGEYGHGGAFSTNMIIDTKHRLILVWMVQHADFPGDGRRSQDVFRKTALELFKSSTK
jgi:CubicO group peptidase (beta-lactamase class C family)